ncbi:MAG: hypothetical protein V1899_05095 [Planctomycetota bacterium]
MTNSVPVPTHETSVAVSPPAIVVAPVGTVSLPSASPSTSTTPEGVSLVSLDEFRRIKLRTAEVISAVPHPKADRLIILQVKIGDRIKQVVAGIRQFYTPEQLIGRAFIIVDNLQPVKIRGEESNGMILAVKLSDGGLRLVTTDGAAPSGLDVS